jgi:hypothetical protein
MFLPLIFNSDFVLKLIGHWLTARFRRLVEEFRPLEEFLHLSPLGGREVIGINFRADLQARDSAGLLATHTHHFPPAGNVARAGRGCAASHFVH